MKTREELEKMFDERFIINQDMGRGNFINVNKQCVDFIFETVIPEMLREIIPKEVDEEDIQNETDLGYKNYLEGFNESLDEIKHNAKEKFNIDL